MTKGWTRAGSNMAASKARESEMINKRLETKDRGILRMDSRYSGKRFVIRRYKRKWIAMAMCEWFVVDCVHKTDPTYWFRPVNETCGIREWIDFSKIWSKDGWRRGGLGELSDGARLTAESVKNEDENSSKIELRHWNLNWRQLWNFEVDSVDSNGFIASCWLQNRFYNFESILGDICKEVTEYVRTWKISIFTHFN